MSSLATVSRLVGLPFLALATFTSPALAQHAAEIGELGSHLPLITVVPFALLLLAIAVLPLIVNEWWEHNRNKAIVALLLSIPET